MAEISNQYLKPIRVAAMRHKGPHDPHIADATWNELILWASPRRMLGRNENFRGIGLLWDDPRRFGPRDRRYDVGIPMDAEDEELLEYPVFMVVTPPGRYLTATHMGDYDHLMQTYDSVLGEIIPNEGLTLLAQPIIEVYRNSPSEVSADELRTDIYFPVMQL